MRWTGPLEMDNIRKANLLVGVVPVFMGEHNVRGIAAA